VRHGKRHVNVVDLLNVSPFNDGGGDLLASSIIEFHGIIESHLPCITKLTRTYSLPCPGSVASPPTNPTPATRPQLYPSNRVFPEQAKQAEAEQRQAAAAVPGRERVPGSRIEKELSCQLALSSQCRSRVPGGSARHHGRGLGQELQNSPVGGRVDLQNSLMTLD
jgi:hypothetical protein